MGHTDTLTSRFLYRYNHIDHFAPIEYKNSLFDASIGFDNSFCKYDGFPRTHQNNFIGAPTKSTSCESAGTEIVGSGDPLYLEPINGSVEPIKPMFHFARIFNLP